MHRRPLQVFLPLLLLLAPSPVLGNNTFFLPGDAFFFARFTTADLEALAEQTSPAFRYGNHWDNGYFCGYAGYERIRLAEMPKSLKQALAEAYERLEMDLEKDSEGVRYMNILFYNADFDWRKHSLGLQYNEDWAEETAAFGHGKDYLRLESFVTKVDALMTSWRDAPRIPQLKIEIPALSADGKPRPEEPVVLRGGYQIIAIPNREFNAYFEQNDGLRLIHIEGEAVKAYVTRNGDWEEE